VDSIKLFLFLQEWRFGRLRSSKVINFDTNRKRVCDFPLVRHSKRTCPILHRFGDIALAGFLCSWSHPYSTLVLGMFSFDQIDHVGVSPRIYLKLNSREIIFEVFQLVWKTYMNITGRQMDRQTDRRPSVALPHCAYHRAVKTKIEYNNVGVISVIHNYLCKLWHSNYRKSYIDWPEGYRPTAKNYSNV